jgi:xanthine dehydrogenase accessory factor
VICDSFENFFRNVSINDSTYVVIVTRGHRHDMLCLKETLNRNTAYAGMIGSKRRVKIVKEELQREGYSEETINRLNAPIGLEINAVTPEEIAISITAQLVSYVRSKKVIDINVVPQKVNYPDFDRALIEELSKGIDEPKAVVTIVSTKGSVPRKSGAKMIVYPDGRIIGSIGGGCSEGEVIIIARDIIRDGGYKLHEVDMTDDVAEDEGMVCGGIMNVVIERV